MDRYGEISRFFEAEFKRSVSLLIYRGATPQEAEDSVSEAMTSLLSRWAEIINPTACLHTAAYRELQKVWRRRAYDRRHGLRHPAPDRYEDQYPSEDDHIRHVIASLPEEQRTVLELHLAGYSNREIAVLVGKLPTTVRSNLRHARKRLENILAQPAATPNTGVPGEFDQK